MKEDIELVEKLEAAGVPLTSAVRENMSYSLERLTIVDKKQAGMVLRARRMEQQF